MNGDSVEREDSLGQESRRVESSPRRANRACADTRKRQRGRRQDKSDGGSRSGTATATATHDAGAQVTTALACA